MDGEDTRDDSNILSPPKRKRGDGDGDVALVRRKRVRRAPVVSTSPTKTSGGPIETTSVTPTVPGDKRARVQKKRKVRTKKEPAKPKNHPDRIRQRLKDAACETIQLYSQPQAHLLVGIDFAYRSPGWSIMYADDPTSIVTYYVSQRKREDGISDTTFHSTTAWGKPATPLSVRIVCAMNKVPQKTAHIKQFHDLSQCIVDTIETHRTAKNIAPENVYIAMEGYAYGYLKMKTPPKTLSKIYESGGVMKNFLYRKAYGKIVLVAPTFIKRVFADDGSSDKTVMLRMYMSRTGLDDPSVSIKFPRPVRLPADDVIVPLESKPKNSTRASGEDDRDIITLVDASVACTLPHQDDDEQGDGDGGGGGGGGGGDDDDDGDGIPVIKHVYKVPKPVEDIVDAYAVLAMISPALLSRGLV